MINVTVKEKAKERPIALNTVELMRVASSGLNMGPHHAMQLAEKSVIVTTIISPFNIVSDTCNFRTYDVFCRAECLPYLKTICFGFRGTSQLSFVRRI